ncbi:MAG: hypothetical protein JWO45_1201 [Spartobacteria bacterium]|nr:hypothetical protein [Spartobacteria bacterium]
MAPFPPESLLLSRRTVWVIASLAALLFVLTNLPWQLDDYDQAKQAFTSFEMIKEGHWLYQTTPHERIATKPPLISWISAGLFSATRSWDLAWRLPSLLAAAVIAVLLYRRAALAYGIAAGAIALAAFSFNLFTPRLATLVRTDVPLTCIIFLIGLSIWENVRTNQTWSSRDRLMIFVLLTAGMLIKGPVIYAFLLPGIVVFQLCRRKTFGASAWPGWWPWVVSLAIFLIWVAAGIRFVPGFYDQVVLREFMGRFGGDIHRSQPLFFYLPHLLHKFAPWSILMIFLAIVSYQSGPRGKRALSEMSPDILWLVCWALGGLVLMSLLPSKRVDRIFPVIPPLCLLLAGQIARISSNEPLRSRVHRWSAASLVVAILFTSSYAFLKISSGYRNHRDALVKFGREVRTEAAARHWRYEVIATMDEGMLLYLRKTHFVRPEGAVTAWNDGGLDALVVTAAEAPSLVEKLKDASISSIRSAEGKDSDSGYVLIWRGSGD